MTGRQVTTNGWSWLRSKAACLTMVPRSQTAIMVYVIPGRRGSSVSMLFVKTAIVGFALGHQRAPDLDSKRSYVSTPTYTPFSERHNTTSTCRRSPTCYTTHSRYLLSLVRRALRRSPSYGKRLGCDKTFSTIDGSVAPH